MGRVFVTALSAFYGTEEQRVVAGQVFPLNEGYARALERKGMVTINEVAPDAEPKPSGTVIGGDQASSVVEPQAVKVKPASANKMNPQPVTKAD